MPTSVRNEFLSSNTGSDYQRLLEYKKQILDRVGYIASDTTLTPYERAERLKLIVNLISG